MLVKTNLQKNTEIIFGLVHNNNLISNAKKSHLLVSSKEQDLLPNSIKDSASLKSFKTKINTWAADRCPFRICKKYVGRVGFI